MADRARLPSATNPEEWERLRPLRVVATPQRVETELQGEAVILHLGTRRFHGLDAVGARIWQLLKQPISIAEVRDALVREYDVSASRCETDLLALLQDLEAARLIEVVDGSPG